MADQKISVRTAASTLTGTEVVGVIQGGNDRKTTTAEIAALASAGNLTYTKVSISSAEILDLFTTPKTVYAAPGAGEMLFPVSVLWVLNYGTAAYATNINLRVRMGGTMMQNSAVLGQTGDSYSLQPLAGGSFALDLSNTAITIDVQTGNPTAGDGTVDVYILYTTITL